MANELMTSSSESGGAGSVAKILALFVLTFFVVFVAGWIYDLFNENFEAQQLETAPTASQPVLTVDPNIEKELAKVLEYETDQPDLDLKDPFSDRSNLSDTSALTLSALPSRDQLATNVSSGAGGASGGGGSNSSKASAETEKKEPPIDIAKVTFEAVKAREAAIRAGRNPGPESAIFFIDDLLPVGMVSGGSAPPEVLMYSISMKKTYSFPAGASFRDGWLATWRSDGVAFGDATKGGAIFLKPWSTSLGEAGDSKQVVIGSADAKETTD